MSWIRSNITLVVILIAIAILAFVVQDGCNSSRAGIGNAAVNTVGTVAGQEIGRQEFAELYHRMLENARARSAKGVLTDQDRNTALSTAWSQLVRNKMYQKELDATGIKVTPQELGDLFTGDPVHSQVQQYFQAFFQQQGKPMNGASVAEYLDQLESSGDQTFIEGFKEFETAIKRYREQEKLDNIFRAAYVSSNAEARREYVAQNRKFDISFLSVPYSSIGDSSITLDDADFSSFIKENDHRFKQEVSSTIRYVKFDIIPSAADTARAAQRVSRLRKAFSETKSDSLFVTGKTRFGYQAGAQEPALVPVAVIDSFIGAEAGEVFGPIREIAGPEAYFKLFKLIEVENGDQSYGKARAITVSYGADSAEARSKARDLKRRANASNFADLMAENNGSQARWYRESMAGEDVFDAIARASTGSIIGPFETRGGYMVLHVMEKTNKKFAFGQIEEKVVPSDRTTDEAYKNANNFAASVQDNANLEAIAAQEGLNSQTSGQLLNTTFNLAGIQEGARQIIRWALKADLNAISEVLPAGQAYVVAQVTEKRSEGLQTVDDVRNTIRAEVLNEKKAAMILDKLQGLSGDLNTIASSYGEGATVQTATGVTFANTNVQGMGNEPMVVGRIAGMVAQDAVSEPLEGNAGVYIVQVTNIAEAAEPDAGTLATQKEAKAATGSNSFQTKAAQAMEELAEVDDNRVKAGY
jgi:peptidyl-prolyl cis-trans isomerase D